MNGNKRKARISLGHGESFGPVCHIIDSSDVQYSSLLA